MELRSDAGMSARRIWSLYVPTIQSIALHKGISWVPTWPLLDSFIHRFIPVVDENSAGGKQFPCINIFSNLKHELALECESNSFSSRWILLSWNPRVLYPFSIKRTTEFLGPRRVLRKGGWTTSVYRR